MRPMMMERAVKNSVLESKHIKTLKSVLAVLITVILHLSAGSR